MKSVDPTTNQTIQNYEPHSNEEIRQIIEKSHLAFSSWKTSPFETRSRLLKSTAELLLQNKGSYSALITREMGKLRREAISEIEKCARVCEYYAEHGPQFLTCQEVKTEASKSVISYQPLGIIFAVMPWNFPFWQVLRFAAPALMAGNAVLLKHASNVSGCALQIEELFRGAGFPENLFRTLLARSEQVQSVIEHPRVQAVTLTGSTNAGRAVASKAGECLKKTVLELGGSDPYLILEDADIEYAAEQCTESRLLNAGQSCIGAKRFIVVQAVHEEFLKSFKEKMGATVYGDPEDDSSDMGPLASTAFRDELHRQVTESVDCGAVCILGGFIPEKMGAYYPPTILTEVKPKMPAYGEELFGPVASVIRAKDETDAIRIANDSVYGLGGGVFTQNLERGAHIAQHEIETGTCVVNSYVRSDPRLPFGGIKQSGYGRELSHFGIREFTNIKTITIR